MSNSGFDWLKGAIPGGGLPEAEDANAIEEQKAMLAEIERQQQELAHMVHSVLTTGRGPELLDYLRMRTIEMASAVDPQASIEAPSIPLNPAEWLFVREGQNSVTRHLEGLIRLARHYANQPQTPKGVN